MRTSILIVALLSADAMGQSPAQQKQAAEAVFQWQAHNVCPCDRLKYEMEAAAVWQFQGLYESCQCPKPCTCCSNGDCKCKAPGDCGKLTQAQLYNQLRDRAVKEKKPLLVGVGCDSPTVSGCLSCRWDGFPGAKAPTVILGRPRNGELWQETYRPNVAIK